MRVSWLYGGIQRHFLVGDMRLSLFQMGKHIIYRQRRCFGEVEKLGLYLMDFDLEPAHPRSHCGCLGGLDSALAAYVLLMGLAYHILLGRARKISTPFTAGIGKLFRLFSS